MTKQEAPWGDMNDMEAYLSWRQGFIQSAREWSNGDIGAFLNNRLTFQRGTRGLESEDYTPWDNPESALYDTLLMLRTEEHDSWTEEEYAKINRITAALISVTYEAILPERQGYLDSPEYSPIDFYFENVYKVTLEDDEAKALQVILSRAGKQIDPEQRVFWRPIV